MGTPFSLHPARRRFREDQMKILLTEPVTEPNQGLFITARLQDLKERLLHIESTLKLGRKDLALLWLGLRPYATTIYDQYAFGQSELTADQRKYLEVEELNTAKEQFQELQAHSADVEIYGCPIERIGTNNEIRTSEHIIWRRRVVQVWEDSSQDPRFRACRYSDLLYSADTPPCKWGLGKILSEYKFRHGKQAMENDLLGMICSEYINEHQAEPRFCPAVVREPPGPNSEIHNYDLAQL
ncbi:hypothetical protein E4T43_01046 [Aureobasidium subglaciale]|nr:hypothetical protein E4T43_01046 [Aureobasidium subglaciale]